MKQNHLLKKSGAILLAVMLSFSMMATALADTPTTGSIEITLNTDLGTSKEGVVFKLYKVGSWTPSKEKWTLDDSLSATGIVLSDIKGSSEWHSKAQTLAEQVGSTTIVPTSGATSAEGGLTFSNLDFGMYLVVQDGENAYGTISPFLAALPVKSPVDGSYTYVSSANPKAAAFPVQDYDDDDDDDDDEDERFAVSEPSSAPAPVVSSVAPVVAPPPVEEPVQSSEPEPVTEPEEPVQSSEPEPVPEPAVETDTEENPRTLGDLILPAVAVLVLLAAIIVLLRKRNDKAE